MKGVVVFSDTYECSIIFSWRKGNLIIRGISYEGDGISINDVIKDISELSGVEEWRIKRFLRKLTRKTGYYYTSLKDLGEFIEEIENGERREIEVVSRIQVVSSII